MIKLSAGFTRKLKLFLVLLSASAFSVLEAKNVTVSGFITDKSNGEVLIGAVVYDRDMKVGTTTNNFGFYTLTLPEGKRNLQISYVGYDLIIDEFEHKSDMTRSYALESSTEIDEIVVKDAKKNEHAENVQMSTVQIPISQVLKIPAILGEVDLIKAIQYLPGVQRGTEGGSGFFVRGGSADQNLILLDGVPVYNVNHLFGFFSVFNSDAINNVQLYKGGFPARFGGRLSSVLDITMKEGDTSHLHGIFSIGIIAGKLNLEGPLGKKKKASFSFSARRTWIDLLARPFMDPTIGVAGYFFYDINAKVNYKISDKDRLYFSIYGGRDKFFVRDRYAYADIVDETEAGLNWGNITGSARWNHIHSSKLFANYSLSFTRYKFRFFFENKFESSTTKEYAAAAYYSSINDIAAAADYSYAPNNKHYFRFGGVLTNHLFRPGAVSVKADVPGFNLDTILGNRKLLGSQELAVYGEDEFSINKRLRVNLGLRLVAFMTQGKAYFFPEPRLSGRYMLNENLSMKASYSNMNQFIHLLANSGIGLPTDLWVPSTKRIKPQNSHQVALGFAQSLSGGIELSLEGYYKWMRNVIDYKEGANFLDVQSDWQNKVESGRGWAYGAEFMLQKKKGRFSGWIAYTLSWSKRQFDEINFGKPFFFKYDRRHNFNLVAMYDISETRNISMTFTYCTGHAISYPNQQYKGWSGNTIFAYEGKNTFRYPYYLRIDLGTSKTKTKRNGNEVTWNFSVYNLTNRANPFFVDVYYDYDEKRYKFTQYSLFPIIPALTYTLKF